MWKGNLRNSSFDVFVDTTLLALIICASLPQLSRVRKGHTRGISAHYLLFKVIVQNAQLSQALFTAAYAWPSASKPVLKEISQGSLRGLRAYGGILGLLQILVQWACALTLLVSYAGAQGNNSSRNIVVIACLHTSAVVVPALVTAIPKPAAHGFEVDVMMGLINMSNQIVAPCFIILHVYAQWREARNQYGEHGALSLLSLCLQTVATAALGFRWLLRLGRPAWPGADLPSNLSRFESLTYWWDLVVVWYQWSFIATNYVVQAFGLAVLLAYYTFTFAKGRGVDEEARIPLLR